MEPDEISLKLKTFAHTEFSDNKYSNINIIKSKIDKKVDLFNRGHQYKKVMLDRTFPKYLHDNYQLYKKFILWFGEVAEWLKAHAWKACKGAILSWVRIPFSPPSKKP